MPDDRHLARIDICTTMWSTIRTVLKRCETRIVMRSWAAPSRLSRAAA
jgi:hypothetical protein